MQGGSRCLGVGGWKSHTEQVQESVRWKKRYIYIFLYLVYGCFSESWVLLITIISCHALIPVIWRLCRLLWLLILFTGLIGCVWLSSHGPQRTCLSILFYYGYFFTINTTVLLLVLLLLLLLLLLILFLAPVPSFSVHCFASLWYFNFSISDSKDWGKLSFCVHCVCSDRYMCIAPELSCLCEQWKPNRAMVFCPSDILMKKIQHAWQFINCYSLVNGLATPDVFFIINQSPPEVHANAAETLCTISRNPTSALAVKISSPRFAIFGCVYSNWLHSVTSVFV